MKAKALLSSAGLHETPSSTAKTSTVGGAFSAAPAQPGDAQTSLPWPSHPQGVANAGASWESTSMGASLHLLPQPAEPCGGGLPRDGSGPWHSPLSLAVGMLGSRARGCGEQSSCLEQPRTEVCQLDWGRGRFSCWS